MILIVGSKWPATAKFSTQKNLGKSRLFVGQRITGTLYHTSLADCANLEEHLPRFETIYWAQCPQSEFKNFKEYFDTIVLLKKFPNVVGLDDDPYNLRQFSTIETDSNNIIFLGCSHTVGGLLSSKDEDYVNIVSSHFNLEPMNLAETGKGNFRSFDQFNKIKFHKNQIVVLQLTDFARLRLYASDLPDATIQQEQLYRIKERSYHRVFNDKQLTYMNLARLESIINLSRALGLRFVFFYLGDVPNFDNSVENDDYKKMVEYYLTDYQEYIPNILGQNVDRTPYDNLHYGAKSNAIWASKIIDKIEELYS
jgi:hypothetical protein